MTDLYNHLKAASIILAFMLITFSLPLGGLHAKSPPVSKPCKTTLCKALAKLSSSYHSLKDMEANFHQVVIVKSLSKEVQSQGTMLLKKPHLIRWEITIPNEKRSLFVSNGKQSLFYTPPFMEGEQGQLIKQKGSGLGRNLAFRLLSGKADMQKEFDVTQSPENPNILELKPLNKEDQNTPKIILELSKALGVAEKVTLHNRGGNITKVTLKNIQINKGLNPPQFRFKPPKNTAIITQ